MDDTARDDAIRTALGTKIDEASPPGPHPDLDDWVGYHEGQLSAEREDALRRHLEGCSDCLALLTDLAAFTAAEDDDATSEPAPTIEVDAIVRAARFRTPSAHGSSAPRWLPLAASVSVVAVLAVLRIVALVRNHRLEERLATLAAPQPGTVLGDFYDDGITHRGATTAQTMILDDDTTWLVWVLHLPSSSTDARFRATLEEPAGTRLWQGRGLVRNPNFNTVRLALPRSFLDPGRYRLELAADTSGLPDQPIAGSPVAVYEIELRLAASDADSSSGPAL